MPSSDRIGHAPQQSGFSLAELLVVLFILGLVGMIAAPRLSSVLSATSNDRALQQLQLLLSDSRRQAVRTNSDTRVYFSVETGEFGPIPGAPVSAFGEEWRASATGAQAEMPDPQTIVFRFFPDGSSTGGNISLETEGETTSITVDWLTGLTETEQAE